eukprot:TRINITY_DN388_c0_g2_i2.p1 TRINITY_DN388_c0_g2~~TRINITY_DN388_c0_g2_i2.p1  ORF type:complete len:1130 (+),score=480.84 TRINITY_DN388_c0_g2_i2:101-3391(+)
MAEEEDVDAAAMEALMEMEEDEEEDAGNDAEEEVDEPEAEAAEGSAAAAAEKEAAPDAAEESAPAEADDVAMEDAAGAEEDAAEAAGAEEEDADDDEDDDDDEDENEDEDEKAAEEELAAEDEDEEAADADKAGEEPTTKVNDVVVGKPRAKRAAMPKPPKVGRKRPLDPKMPLKPQAPYFAFSGKIRPQLIESDPNLKSNLAAMGSAIKEAWGKLPEDEKAKMQAEYEKQKAVWDALMEEYRKTPGAKEHAVVLRAWMDMREMKKLEKKERTREGGCPKRPASGFGLFGAKVRLELQGKGLGLSEIGKAIGERWNALPGGEKDKYSQSAKSGLEKYTKDYAAYKRSAAYRSHVDDRAQLEKKQALRRLKAEFEEIMPKRPPMMSHLVMKSKGCSAAEAAKVGEALPEEEKKQLKAQLEEMKEKYAKDFAAFKESADGKRYFRLEAAAKKGAELRAAKLKFLVDAPKQPERPKTVFANQRREAATAAGATPPTTAQLDKLWEELPASEKAAFDAETEKLRAEYETKWKEFEKTKDYANYKAVEKRMVSAEDKAKAKAKATAAKAKATAVKAKDAKAKAKARETKLKAKEAKEKAKAKTAVKVPDSMPKKPKTMLEMWSAEQKAANAKASPREFAALPAQEKKRLAELQSKEKAEYEAAMKKWQSTAEGKRFQRSTESLHQKEILKKRLEKARAAFFGANGGEPQRPANPMMLFAASGEAKGKKVAIAWSALTAEEKKKWDDKRAGQVQEYEKKMKAFIDSALYRRATKEVSSSKAKKEQQNREGMPQKPPHALLLACQAKKVHFKEGGKMWHDLPPEEKAKFTEQAKVLREKYEKEVEAWKLSKQGKKHKSEEVAKRKKKMEQRAREKYLQGKDAPQPPKAPLNALKIFLEEKKKILLENDPKLSMGAVAVKLTNEWKALDEAGKKPWNEKETLAKKTYDRQMEAYKTSPAYRKYLKAVGQGGTVSKKDKDAEAARLSYEEDLALIYGKEPKTKKGGGGGDVDSLLEELDGAAAKSAPPTTSTGRGAGRGRGRGASAAAAAPEPPAKKAKKDRFGSELDRLERMALGDMDSDDLESSDDFDDDSDLMGSDDDASSD